MRSDLDRYIDTIQPSSDVEEDTDVDIRESDEEDKERRMLRRKRNDEKVERKRAIEAVKAQLAGKKAPEKGGKKKAAATKGQ